jgi:hypothetical protein
MGQERKAGELRDAELVAFSTVAFTMNPRQLVVRLDSTGGAFTVTLPPVSECFGKFYSLRLTAGSNTITIADQGDCESASYPTLTAPNQKALLYCDGLSWLSV